MTATTIVATDDHGLWIKLRDALQDLGPVVRCTARREVFHVLKDGANPQLLVAESSLGLSSDIRKEWPWIKQVVLVNRKNAANIARCVAAGADGAFPRSDLDLVTFKKHCADLLHQKIPTELPTSAWEKLRSTTRTPSMLELLDQVDRVASSDATVLINGETGTGKELIARALHDRSQRRGNAFVVVHCGALSSELVERELFGHRRGSFTGAHEDQPGLLDAANRGTAYLDEISTMTMAAQVRLLRFLQDREIRPVGETRSYTVNVRVLAASNLDLVKLIELGRFREDLFYRLRVVELTLPPLRTRRDDLPLLIDHFWGKACMMCGRCERRSLTDEARAAFQAYAWPGNIRELENTLHGIAALCGGGPVKLDQLPARIRCA